MINYFLFDLDGTLVNSNKANFLGYQAAYKDLGIAITEEQYIPYQGQGFNELAATFSPEFTEEQKKELKQLKAQHYPKMFDQLVPNDSLLSFLRMVSKNYACALVTTASKKNALAVLKYLNVETCFSTHIFGEDVQAYKPDPECYLLALEKLNARANECLAFEDSNRGVSAATGANIQVVKV